MEIPIKTNNNRVNEKPLLVLKVQMDVHFISSIQEKASIKIGIEPLNSIMTIRRFIHLPPLHRLKKSHAAIDCLKKSTCHKIQYLEEFNEPRVVSLDGEDLNSLWEFLDAKTVCNLLIFTRLIN